MPPSSRTSSPPFFFPVHGRCYYSNLSLFYVPKRLDTGLVSLLHDNDDLDTVWISLKHHRPRHPSPKAAHVSHVDSPMRVRNRSDNWLIGNGTWLIGNGTWGSPPGLQALALGRVYFFSPPPPLQNRAVCVWISRRALLAKTGRDFRMG